MIKDSIICQKMVQNGTFLVTKKCHLSAYNRGHNILELYSVLVQIRLTTSKTKRDI